MFPDRLLDMFLRDQDPVSVHSLAMAGGEIAEQLASNAGAEPFVSHVLRTFPDIDLKEIRTLQRKFSNAFKHATTRDGQPPQLSCDPGPEFEHPAPHRFIGNLQATLGQEILNVAVAQWETEVQPNCVLDRRRREAMPAIGQ